MTDLKALIRELDAALQLWWNLGKCDGDVPNWPKLLRDSVAALRSCEQDSARLDWLEGEGVRENTNNAPHYVTSIFRRNVPITRSSIDAAIAAEQDSK